MNKIKTWGCFFLLLSINGLSQSLITEKKAAGSFPVVSATAATAIYTDEKDAWLVQKSASLLQHDIEMVTGKKPQIIHTIPAAAQNLVIVGSIIQSDVIQQLQLEKKLA